MASHLVRDAAALHADLHHAVVFARGVHHLLAFENVVAGRLLAIHVFARLAGPDGGQRMPVIGRGDGDRVDVLVVVKLPQILIDFGLFASLVLDHLGAALGLRGIHIAECGDARARQLQIGLDVVLAAPADSDDGDVHFIVRGQAWEEPARCP